MTQKIIVNGTSYDSVDAMPPDVRRQYENAMQLLKGVEENRTKGPLKTTVENVPGGVSINVERREVKYNIDGKTYDDPAQLPPEIRAKIDEADGRGGQGVRTDVRLANVEIARTHRGRWILWWLLIAAIAALIFGILLPEP